MSLRFPAASAASLDEFNAWIATARATLDQRWLYEQREIAEDRSARRDGTCGLCLAPTRFASAAPADQRNWREEMNCGCPLQLSNRQRALLHFARARTDVGRGSRAVVIGPESNLDGKLAQWGASVACTSRLVEGRLRVADGSADLAICADYLQQVPPLGTLLREFGRILRPGGALLLTLPFDVNAPATKSRAVELPRGAADSYQPLHLFGWDVLDWLRDVGFGQVAAHFYWSDEFGYLGPFNMIVSGIRG